MARQILYMHWKAMRLGLVPLMIAAFGLPLLVIQGVGRPDGIRDGFYTSYVLDKMQPLLPAFPALAAAIGIVMALSAWSWDHQVKHVYALSLPVARWRYASMKFGAGALLILLPTAALLGGAFAASASVQLPPLLHAYPLALATRFFFSALVVYALMFALAAGSIRTTVILVTVWVALLLGGNLLAGFVADLTNQPQFLETDWVFRLLTAWPGPFHMLTGNWSLIDV